MDIKLKKLPQKYHKHNSLKESKKNMEMITQHYV